MKDLLHRVEAALVWLVYHLFRLLPVDAASGLGGFIGRNVGPLLPVTRRARDNLRRFLPEADAETVIRGMWDNLGRSVGEFPHCEQICADPARMRFEGFHHLEALRGGKDPALLFSGHIGNWELSYAINQRAGLRVHPVYRNPNNPYLRWLFVSRSRGSDFEMIPKGAAGARQTIKLLGQGETICMFVDQKMNDGIAVPFFGRPAMTAPALASLALKYDRPVIPVRIVRVKGAHFCMEVLPPFRFERSGDRNDDVLRGMTRVNQLLESWIREYPEQWLWLHRRWPRSLSPKEEA
jgi:KDO2-lipid IV(A) lauroyltransferase